MRSDQKELLGRNDNLSDKVFSLNESRTRSHLQAKLSNFSYVWQVTDNDKVQTSAAALSYDDQTYKHLSVYT